MSTPYTVALQDARDLPQRDRIAAEVRFATELERRLGGAQGVAQVYAAWVAASETEASQLDCDTTTLAVRWPSAVDAALRAGFHRLGDIGDARFVVKLERQRIGVPVGH
jgi:hypothetical protein